MENLQWAKHLLRRHLRVVYVFVLVVAGEWFRESSLPVDQLVFAGGACEACTVPCPFRCGFRSCESGGDTGSLVKAAKEAAAYGPGDGRE